MQGVRNLSPDLREASATSNDGVRVIARDLFASPVVLCEWPATERLNAELRKAIIKRFETSPSVVQSARNAWQSEHTMHKWPEPCVAEFVDMLKIAASKFAAYIAPEADKGHLNDWRIVSCFANVNPPGGFSRPHDHVDTGALISGVYYVDLGECDTPAHAGRTILQDRSGVARPTWKGRDPLSREYGVPPKPGAALLFTAAQIHCVEPYRGKGVRISIAFNITHPDFDVLYYPGMKGQTWWWRNFRGLMIIKEKVPEKLRALSLFGSYLGTELRRPRHSVSFWRRVRSAFQRAQVDAQAPEAACAVADGQLPEKRQLEN